MKKIIILVIGTALVLGLGIYCFASEENYDEELHGHDHEMGHKMAHEEDLSLSGVVEDNVRIVKVTAYRYGFKPDPIVVRQGEKIKLEVTSTDATHGLAIKDLGVNVIAPVNEVSTVEFAANEVGDFHIHCSFYCGSGHGRMHGTLKVIE